MNIADPMDIIEQYAINLEVNTTRGGCPEDKLDMFNRLSCSNIHFIRSSERSDDYFSSAKVMYAAIVKVKFRRARASYERSWGWTDDKYVDVTLCMYNRGLSQLLIELAQWLEDNHDKTTPPVAHTHRHVQETFKTIYLPEVADYRHYTNPLD